MGFYSIQRKNGKSSNLYLPEKKRENGKFPGQKQPRYVFGQRNTPVGLTVLGSLSECEIVIERRKANLNHFHQRPLLRPFIIKFEDKKKEDSSVIRWL